MLRQYDEVYGSGSDLGVGLVIIGVAVLLLGLIGWAIGTGKGRGAAGFWLGALLGPIGLVIVAVMEPAASVQLQRTSQQAAALVAAQQSIAIQLRPCTWCAEMIQPKALVCRYCGRDVEPTAMVDSSGPGSDAEQVLLRQYGNVYYQVLNEAEIRLQKYGVQFNEHVISEACARAQAGESVEDAFTSALWAH